MKKPFSLTTKHEEEAPRSKTTKSYAHLDEDDSYENSQISDTDSVSYESKKIRKKRNTYHKISDDIRILLLEAVQNGETLKAVAKRHNINYSSAKSILHTYRKEGRILKKSVQERSFKKKTEIIEAEVEQTLKQKKKTLKKESSHPPMVTRNFEEPNEEATEEPLLQQSVRKSERLRMNSGNNQTQQNVTAMDTKPQNIENAVVKEKVPQVEEPAMAMVSGPASAPQAQYADHYYPHAEGGHHNDHKLFDNFFNSYQEPTYRNNMQNNYGGQDEHYHMDYHYPKEFDSFGEMMDTLHHRPMKGYGYQDANSFLCSREVNMTHLFDERGHKTEGDMHCNNGYESAMGSVFKNFLDPQNMFRDTFRESPFGNNENNFRYRKDSIDFS